MARTAAPLLLLRRGCQTGGARPRLAWGAAHVAEHKRRMEWLPHLYHQNRTRYEWAEPWQAELQTALAEVGRVDLAEHCFVAPSAVLIAAHGKRIRVGARSSIAAECFLHGPVELGDDVSLNARCHIDGGTKGVRIGDSTRIAEGCRLVAFDHGMDPAAEVRAQRCTSEGIEIGKDVWIGAGVGVVDGVTIGDHAVVGMGSVVTRSVADWEIVAGSPARKIGDRREKGGAGARPLELRGAAPNDTRGARAAERRR